MKLAAIGKNFGSFELGAPDAEADKRLASYFVRTPYVDSALQLHRTLFLGRKGAGKSALFTQLTRLMREAGYNKTKVLTITPDNYAWHALKEYTEKGLLPEQAHANAWKFTIATQIAVALIELNVESLQSNDAKNAFRSLETFVKNNYNGSEQSLLTTTKRLIEGIKSFNFSAFGFGAGLSRETEEPHLVPQIISAIFGASSLVSNGTGVVVAIDKLDDSWDGSEKSKQLLIGLLKASKEINDKYRSIAPDKGIANLVFLRSDIYEGLLFDDKDKHRATEENIVWNSKLLADMIKERIPDGVTTDDLFEEGEMRGSITPFEYIVKRTFLRPREVIQFLQECIRLAGSNATEITKDEIKKAEERYSSWKVEDLKQEYRRLYPDFDKILESLRQGQHRYDSIEELEKYISDRIPELAASLGVRRIIELLFNASAVGVRLRNSGSTKFRSEDSDLVLPAAGAVYVHQGLYRGLNIREKRTREGKKRGRTKLS